MNTNIVGRFCETPTGELASGTDALQFVCVDLLRAVGRKSASLFVVKAQARR